MFYFKLREWSAGKELAPQRARRPMNELLANIDRILGPPLLIRLGLTVQCTNSLDRGSNYARNHKELEKYADCFFKIVGAEHA